MLLQYKCDIIHSFSVYGVGFLFDLGCFNPSLKLSRSSINKVSR